MIRDVKCVRLVPKSQYSKSIGTKFSVSSLPSDSACMKDKPSKILKFVQRPHFVSLYKGSRYNRDSTHKLVVSLPCVLEMVTVRNISLKPIITFLVLISVIVSAEKLSLEIERSEESLIYLTDFAFSKNGHILINVSHLTIFSPEKSSPPDTFLMGFFRVHRKNFSAIRDKLNSTDKCILTSPEISRMFSVMEMGRVKGDGERPSYGHHEEVREEGDFLFYFANCAPSRLVSASVYVELYQKYNNGTRNYLPAGSGPLAYLCFIAALGFWVLTGSWLWQAKKTWFQTHTPQTFHFTFTILLVVNITIQIVNGIRFLVIQYSGRAVFWNVLLQAELFLQAILILITFFSGLSKMEPYLNELEQGLVVVAIPGLVVTHFIPTILSYNTLGTEWDTCISLLNFVIAVVEILSWALVIGLLGLSFLSWFYSTSIMSRTNRRQTRRDLEDIEHPFERFYVICLSYIVAASFGLKILKGSLPFYLTWVGHTVELTLVIAFYAFVLYKSRPKTEKSVYQLFDETDDLDEELDNF